MRPLIQEVQTAHTPESLVAGLQREPGRVLLRTAQFDSSSARYSYVAARPFLTFRSLGSCCGLYRSQAAGPLIQFGNPWRLLDALMARYEVLDEIDWPFPLGGAFGYWGYDLKNFTEPKLRRRAVNDLELPDCHVGFYDSLVVFDHQLGKVMVVSAGVDADGSRNEARAGEQAAFWRQHLQTVPMDEPARVKVFPGGRPPGLVSNFSRAGFIAAVERAQQYIRAGDIYQVNLTQRLTAQGPVSGWEMYQQLAAVSPAPFAAYLDCRMEGQAPLEIASSSPEQFLR